jgi:PadR family transcriptional regulator, regulatory protein AphA
VPALTSTSYAVLALLALQPWTTYQLARQMERSLGWIWPRAVSRLYEEPKKLVAAGLASSRAEATGRRPSTVYSITPAGREALASWLAEPGAGPLLECEALVKIAYADQGTRAGLLANLDALVEDTTAKLRFGELIARQYLDGRGPFQQRLAVSGLMWRFLWEYNTTVLRWARWARAEVEAWPEDLSGLDVTAEFGRIVAAASDPGDPAALPVTYTVKYRAPRGRDGHGRGSA